MSGKYNQALNMRNWLGLLSLSGAVVLLASLPPFLALPWRFVMMESFSALCHQLPERSFHIHDASLAVCHRCYGIYLGLFGGSVFLTILPESVLKRRWLVRATMIALAIMCIDWILPFLDLGQNTMQSRFITGVLFGIAGGGLLGQAVAHSQRSQIEIRERNFV